MNKYPLRGNYFEAIDTEEKAYFLGLIAADGCVYKGRFRLALAVVDDSHVRKLAQAVGCGEAAVKQQMFDMGPDLASPGRRKGIGSLQTVLAFGSKEFTGHLRAHGIAENKSQNLGPIPIGVPPQLARHYYRGLFDGDGWISEFRGGRTHRLRWELGLCGTAECTQDFADAVFSATGVRMNQRPAGSI